MNSYWPISFLESAKQIYANLKYADAIDIIIVAFLIYGIMLLLKRMGSFFVAGGLAILLTIYLVGRFLNLYLTSLIFQAFFAFLVVIFVIVFQREIRNFFEWISVWGNMTQKRKETLSEQISHQIIKAVDYLAKNKIGALIVLTGQEPLDHLITGGFILDGKISSPLLLSIFDPSSPGHDGAMIIEGSRIKKFGAHLPLAEKFAHFENLGTRHRAALGLAERSDALTIIISEERGTISLTQEGKLRTLIDIKELPQEIATFLKEKFFGQEQKPWYAAFNRNIKEKISAALISSTLWFIFVIQLGGGTVSRQFEVPIEFRFLPKEYIIEQLNPKTVTLTLSGRTQNFNLLNQDSLKVLINLTEVNNVSQKISINKNLIAAPPALTIIDFAPKTVQFKLGRQIKE